MSDEYMRALLQENGVEVWSINQDDGGAVMLTWGTLKRIVESAMSEATEKSNG